MRARSAALALGVLALACAAVRGDETRKPAPSAEPDPGFLEFLGSVDRLADVSPEYLAQTDPARARLLATGRVPPPPPPPPPPASPPGAKQ
jgi:hypothetical protein